MKINEIYQGDCLVRLADIKDSSVDLIYLDPPFFTQKKHVLKTKAGNDTFSFSDSWKSLEHYLSYLEERLRLAQQKLKPTGSLCLHCDKSASHYLKVLLDNIFGIENFQSEIIWSYRRWSNAKKGLLSNHQTIFFYSKSKDFKFNKIFENYSPSTNVDQIVQLRKRDNRKKTIYQLDSMGNPILAASKVGVPMGDVWDIPFLNPKANERVNYPTQKPILLLERIILLLTDKGDLVVDPFCGSGTTAVAAKLLERKFIVFDQNKAAVKLAKSRLKKPLRTESKLLQQGRSSYERNDKQIVEVVKALSATLVQRNKGIDGLLSANLQIIPFKVVFEPEQLEKSAILVHKSTQKNKFKNKAIYCNKKMNREQVNKIEKMYNLIVFDSIKTLEKKLSVKC